MKVYRFKTNVYAKQLSYRLQGANDIYLLFH